jgi:hypothetical protein
MIIKIRAVDTAQSQIITQGRFLQGFLCRSVLGKMDPSRFSRSSSPLLRDIPEIPVPKPGHNKFLSPNQDTTNSCWETGIIPRLKFHSMEQIKLHNNKNNNNTCINNINNNNNNQPNIILPLIILLIQIYNKTTSSTTTTTTIAVESIINNSNNNNNNNHHNIHTNNK